MKDKKPLIAVVNSNEDIIEGIQLLLTDEGYPSVAGHVISFKKGRENFIEFLKTHKPEIIIFDIAPPYEHNWNFFQILRNLKEVDGITFIVTTTNKLRLEEFAGDINPHEIIGKPFDMKELIEKVNEAVKKRS